MNTTTTNGSGGVGFFGLLTIAFIVLKLTGVIDWSWWWVLAPIWVGVVVCALILLGFAVFLLRRPNGAVVLRRERRR